MAQSVGVKEVNKDTFLKNETGISTQKQTQEETHISHKPTIFAEGLFNIGNFTVTNALINSWVAVFLLIIIASIVKNKIKQIPKGIQNFFEIIIEKGLDLCDTITENRQKSLKVFPFVFTIFIFILVNNYLGLLPGIGSIGMITEHSGELSFIPYFRGGTADLNTTLALSLLAVFLANVFGILTVGAWNYFNKFVNFKALSHPFLYFIKHKKENGFIKALLNLFIELFIGIVNFAVGLIEIIGEVAKVASLSFRLFGNIFAGEVLLSSIAVIMAIVVPIPFMFLEIIVGLVQALVFSILTTVYFTLASMEHDH